jgi:hypothetical protein
MQKQVNHTGFRFTGELKIRNDPQTPGLPVVQVGGLKNELP